MQDKMKSDWDERAKSNARFYIATAEAAGEESFAASGKRDVEAFFSGLTQLLRPDAKVLDIGCGIGRMDAFVASSVRELVGVDVSGEMIQQARTRLAAASNVSFYENDGMTLSQFADEEFDLAFSHIVFQHVPRAVTRSYFREVHRVLSPGGAFVFQLPEANAETPADPPEEDTFEMRFYSEDEARRSAEEAGFSWGGVKRFEVIGASVVFNQLRICCHKA